MERPAPEAYSPRLSWWGQVWRVLLCLAISALVWPQYVDDQWRIAPALLFVDLGGGALAFGLMFLRRRWPLPIALATNAITAVSGSASGPATLCAASLAARRRVWPILATGVTGVVGSMVYAGSLQGATTEPWWATLAIAVIVMAATMGWGLFIGSRRELIWTLKTRAERAEAEQELRAAQARSTERSRIAREMHDVLAHRISQISLHAGALSFRDDLSAEQMRSSAAVIQSQAHEALTDLRGVLGVLRDQSGELMHTPQPTYDDLGDLVAEARRGGLRVDYHDGLAGQPVPEAVGRTVFRIVQEGITNTRKHAPGASLVIEVGGSPHEGIDVSLTNPLGFGRTTTPGAGLGLVGLSERAELRGGRLEHHRGDGAFVLHGWIPWAA